MSVMKVRLTCDEARGLKCPFTGRELAVFANVSEGVTTYNAPNAYSVHRWFVSAPDLYRAASMRNGIYGAVPVDKANVDPYTGESMTIETDRGKYRFVGGFDPTVPCLTLRDFVLKASCGKRDIGTPPKMTSVERLPDVGSDDGAHKAVEDLTDEAAHQMANAIPGVRKTKVGYRGKTK